MKKQILMGLAATALACGALAQGSGMPDRVQAYGNSGWTPDQAYDGSQQTEQGARTQPNQRGIDPRILRDRELRDQRDRALAQQRERDLRERQQSEWDRERRVAQQRERELRDRELRQLRERDRALAQQRERERARLAQAEREHAQRLAREREFAQMRERDRRSNDGNWGQRSWDRDGDGVANRVDRAPDDPRYR